MTTCSVVEGVDQWLQLGGRHIDTAHDYGTEPDVGEALKKSDANNSLLMILFYLFLLLNVFDVFWHAGASGVHR